MNKNLLKSVFAWLTLSVCGAANATLITFNDIAVGSVIANQYISDGVVFSGWEDGSEVNLTTSNVFSPTFGNYLGNSADGTSFPLARWDEIRMDFVSSVDNLTFKLYTHGQESVTFNAYDMFNNLLETIVMTSDPWGDVTFASSGIAKVSALQPNDDWYWAMDEVSFDINLVPEPSTLLIFSLGLIGLASRKFNR